jgi:hypothetical protein
MQIQKATRIFSSPLFFASGLIGYFYEKSNRFLLLALFLCKLPIRLPELFMYDSDLLLLTVRRYRPHDFAITTDRFVTHFAHATPPVLVVKLTCLQAHHHTDRISYASSPYIRFLNQQDESYV